MTSRIPDPQSPPAWLVDWLREAGAHAQCHSLVLSATCNADLHSLACAVATYLNEFDGLGGCQWRAFEVEELRQLAGDPTSRSLLLAGSDAVPERIPPFSDLDMIARRLARIGGVILEGQCGFDATTDIQETFHVCLCKEDHASHDQYHLWINPDLFATDTLVTVISDSFLNWSSVPGSISHRHAVPAAGSKGSSQCSL